MLEFVLGDDNNMTKLEITAYRAHCRLSDELK